MNQTKTFKESTFLKNGGKTGSLIQTFNWSATPLGAIEEWSPTLKVALQILLSSRFPMQILWGSDYIQFYNDAYIPIAGNKHPVGIGQRAAECWQEVWDFVGPMLDRVMATGEATWSEDQLLVLNRNGQAQEGYFTFSYTPIWNEFGKVGGIFITVNETTQRILGEQRERALRAEVQAAKETLENVLNTAPASIAQCRFFSNRTFIVDYHSVGCEAVTGYTPDEITSALWNSRVVAEDWEAISDQLFEAVFQQKPITVEYRFLHKDGSMRWISDNLTSRRDEAQDCWIVTMVGINITARKQAEEALRRSKTHLAMAQRVAQFGSWEFYPANQQSVWSDAMFDQFGFDPTQTEPSYAELMQRIHPDDRQMVEHYVDLAITQGKPCAFDLRVLLPNGTIRYLHARCEPVFDTQEQVSKLMGTCLDITEHKQIEMALRESEERYRVLAETMPQMVWMADRTGVQFWNQRWYDYTGIQPDASLGTGGTQIVHPDEQERTLELWQQAIEKGQGFDIEQRIRRHDGVYRWFLNRGLPVQDHSGQINRWVGTITDIDDQKQLETERARLLEREQAAREAAENANRIKDEFLAVLSHELRSPLNPILGWAKLLRMRKLDAAKTDAALETIERNAKLQAQLIDDLLDVSRILRGKLVLNSVPVSLVSVIEDALETVRSTSESKGVQIQTQLDSTPYKILGDANRLKQVVWNLLSNAVKFTPEDGQVTVRLDYGSELAQIQVSDTGKGIPADFLPHVFDRFRQADSTTTRIFGGLGLGLAIAHQIVEMHGGTIRAESLGEGQGAIFTVQFPLVFNPTELPSGSHLTSVDNLRNLHVLVIEDDVDSRDLITTTLQQFGAKVTAVPSAVAALTALAHLKPDVLISDIGMPGMDGYMLMQQIREVTHTNQIPAIALTAYTTEADQQKAREAGFQQHLAKPMEPIHLVKAISTLVHHRPNAETYSGVSQP